MLLYGLIFVLFYTPLSGSSGFWKSLQTTDKTLHKVVVLYQKSLRKLEKRKLDINFLNRCKDTNVFPKFVRWRSVKHKPLHIKSNLYRKNLNNAINERNNEIRKLSAERDTNKTRSKQATTWIRYKLVIYSINDAQSKINTITSARHQKKHDALIVNKRITDAIKKNPNNLITNLTRFEITFNEVEVLNFGLKQGVLSRPKE